MPLYRKTYKDELVSVLIQGSFELTERTPKTPEATLLDQRSRKPVISTLAFIVSCYVFMGCAAQVRQRETSHSKSKTYKLSDLLSDRVSTSKRTPARQVSRAPLPKETSSIRTLSRNKCYKLLKQYNVAYKAVSQNKARGIRIPIRLTGTISGFRVTKRNKRESNGYLDCRMAVALAHWVRILTNYGFTAIEFSSIYRRNARVGGSSKVSGHAHGLAIDIDRFTFGNQRTLEILDDWVERDRGDDPCSKEYDEPVSSQLMRRAVCDAAARKLFQVVLTPHHNRAHANHVHLEIVPGVDWEYIR